MQVRFSWVETNLVEWQILGHSVGDIGVLARYVLAVLAPGL